VDVRLSLSSVGKQSRLFSQLLDIFKFYLTFEIHDHTGLPLTDQDMAAQHFAKVRHPPRDTQSLSCFVLAKGRSAESGGLWWCRCTYCSAWRSSTTAISCRTSPSPRRQW
jgi:hypothetical protein